MNHRIRDLDLRHAYEEGYDAGREQGLRFICDNCYQPRHAKSPAYYRVRTLVRALFWTAVVTISSAVGIAAIWILWAVN